MLYYNHLRGLTRQLWIAKIKITPKPIAWAVWEIYNEGIYQRALRLGGVK